MKEDHVFLSEGYSAYVSTRERYKEFKYEHVRCKYCGIHAFKDEDGNYVSFNNVKCLTGEEKIIKDLLE